MFSLFLFKQETAYEVRISDWSSDVCSSDLFEAGHGIVEGAELARGEPVCPLPQIVAGQTDMHPAHRREMGKQRIIEGAAGGVEMLGGTVHTDGDPVRNSRDQQKEARCSILLILDRTMGEPPQTGGVAVGRGAGREKMGQEEE